MAAAYQEHGALGADVTETAVNPQIVSVRDHWEWVKRGVEEILAEQPQLTFRPEDVYAACLSEQAHLWVVPEGFVITTGERDQFTGSRTFLFWLVWAKERGQNFRDKYYPFFEHVARENGFQKIETRTPVSALEEYLVAEGWTKDTVIYTREL